MKAFQGSILRCRKPSDLGDSQLAHLNIHVEHEVPLSEFIPVGHFESRPFLYDADLTTALNELEYDNQDAFREVMRLPPLDGKPKPRLTYSRNFFASLEDMSRYWDCTKDEYFEIPVEDTPNDSGRMDKRSESRGNNVEDEPGDVTMTGTNEDEQKSSIGRENSRNVENHSGVTEDNNMASNSKKQVYRGYRIGNGEQMSPGTRAAAVRNFLKMAIYKFGCRDYDLSPQEKMRIGHVNLPMAQYNFCVAKVPADMKSARARMVEGPVLAAYMRNDTTFRQRDGCNGANTPLFGEPFDFSREIGAHLMLAMQRARRGKEKPVPSPDSQWWTTKVRWGGGPSKWGSLANEVYEDEDPSCSPLERQLQIERRQREEDEKRKLGNKEIDPKARSLEIEDLIASHERPAKKKRSTENAEKLNEGELHDGRRLVYIAPARRKWYRDWVKLRPNAPSWDDKIIYRSIGKDTGPFDTIFMVSSANHHVCLTRLIVHEKYIEWLETGQTVSKHYDQLDDEDPNLCILRFSRSKWYDMFDIEQRKEFLIGLWRVLCWLHRDECPKEEFEKMENEKKRLQDQTQNSG